MMKSTLENNEFHKKLSASAEQWSICSIINTDHKRCSSICHLTISKSEHVGSKKVAADQSKNIRIVEASNESGHNRGTQK